MYNKMRYTDSILKVEPIIVERTDGTIVSRPGIGITLNGQTHVMHDACKLIEVLAKFSEQIQGQGVDPTAPVTEEGFTFHNITDRP